MRIKVINPVILTSMDWLPLMEKGYADAHDPDTELEFVFLEKGIESPEQHFWEDLQMTHLIQEIEKTDQESFDGLIVFCAADPGVAAAKEWLHIPTVGILESSVMVARLLGRRFTWISPLSRGNGFVLDKIRLSGHEERLASIRSIEIPVVELHQDDALLEKTTQEGRLAVEQDGADTLILGCTGMFGLASNAQKELGIPVIDAGVAGIRTCEMLVKMSLAQSKRAYPTPRKEMGRRM
jgi:allantoin racemase